MWEVFSPKKRKEPIIVSCEKVDCRYKKSTVDTYIFSPFPKILTLNFNWVSNEINSTDLLKVYMSFRDAIALTDFYKLDIKYSV